MFPRLYATSPLMNFCNIGPIRQTISGPSAAARGPGAAALSLFSSRQPRAIRSDV